MYTMTTRSFLTACAFIAGIGCAYIGLLEHTYIAPTVAVAVGTTRAPRATIEESPTVRVAPATHGVRATARRAPTCITEYMLGGTVTTCR